MNRKDFLVTVSMEQICESFLLWMISNIWYIHTKTDFICTVGTPYVHETMKEYLSRNLFSLSKLPYKEMKLQLLSRKIITFEDIRRNECMYGDNMMRMVLDTMQRGLAFKVTKYFKQFLEIMEESNNPVWQRTAEKLGE